MEVTLMNHRNTRAAVACCAIVAISVLTQTRSQAAEDSLVSASYLDQTASRNVGPQNEQVDARKYKQVFHVSTNGSDENGDGSKERPWKSPVKALAAIADATAENTCAVLVAAGSYDVK